MFSELRLKFIFKIKYLLTAMNGLETHNTKLCIIGSPAAHTGAIYAARAELKPLPLRRMDGQWHRSGRPANNHHRRRELLRFPGRHPRFRPNRQLLPPIGAIRLQNLHRDGEESRLLLEAVQALHGLQSRDRRSETPRLPRLRRRSGGFWNRGISACAVWRIWLKNLLELEARRAVP